MDSNLRAKIESAHAELAKARNALFETKDRAIEAKEDLNSSIIALYQTNRVEGKNDKEREASIKVQTLSERTALSEAEFDERVDILKLELALDERRLWEDMIRIEELDVA